MRACRIAGRSASRPVCGKYRIAGSCFFALPRRNLRKSAILLWKRLFSYSSTTNCYRFRLDVVILPSFFFSPQGCHLLLSRLRREKFAECGKVFGSNPKRFELLKIYLAMFLRTSSLKRLHSFGAAENIPCCVQKNTTLKFLFVVCEWWDCHSIGKQYGSLSSFWAIRLYSLHVCDHEICKFFRINTLEVWEEDCSGNGLPLELAGFKYGSHIPLP